MPGIADRVCLLILLFTAVFHVSGCFVKFVNPEDSSDGGATCGNGFAEPGETCDGSDLAGHTCETLGLGPGDLACAPDCKRYDTGYCGLPGCGDNMRVGNEACDGIDLANQTCETLGFGPGALACKPDCRDFDSSGCTAKPLGSSCATDAECEGSVCWTEQWWNWPAGYCTGPCEYDDDCGQLAICLPVGGGERRCHRTCARPEDCRPGYACFDIDATRFVCWPHCTQDSDCPETDMCNLWPGLCGIEVTGADNGAPCNEPWDCMSEECDTSEPGGYCYSFCALTDYVCPSGSICVDEFQGSAAELGVCREYCETTADCRPGYECTENFCRTW